MNVLRLSNSLDPDQDGQKVGPDLDPNCLQRLSLDDKSQQARQSVKLPMLYAPFSFQQTQNILVTLCNYLKPLLLKGCLIRQ